MDTLCCRIENPASSPKRSKRSISKKLLGKATTKNSSGPTGGNASGVVGAQGLYRHEPNNMDCSYPTVYASYAKFCNMICQTPLSFENWMSAREDAAPHKDRASEFLHDQSSVPGSPVPACSPR